MSDRIREEIRLLLHPLKENDDRFQKYPSWLRLFHHTRIREETDDHFTYISEKKGKGYGLIALGIFILIVFSVTHGNSWSLIFYLYLISSAFLILRGFFVIMNRELVTIDKQSQNVIIKYSNIYFLKSVKEIPFSNIEKIEIKRHSHEESNDSWSINMKKNYGGSIKIYDTNYESDAEGLAEKICKITGKKIFHV